MKENDKVLLASGEIETIDKKTVEELKESVKVYNFEVDDWHTYFVSDIGVFVHNMCAMPNPPNGAAQTGQKLLFGSEWNDYFKETYGSKNVGCYSNRIRENEVTTYAEFAKRIYLIIAEYQIQT